MPDIQNIEMKKKKKRSRRWTEWRRGHHLFHNPDLFAQILNSQTVKTKRALRRTDISRFFNVWATLHIGGNAEVEVPTLLRRPTRHLHTGGTPRRHAGEDLDERDVRFQQQIPSESSFSSSFWCVFFFFLSLLRWREGVRPWLLLLSHGSARKGNLTDTDWAERGEREREETQIDAAETQKQVHFHVDG